MGLLLFWYVTLAVVVFAVRIPHRPFKTAIQMALLVPIAIGIGVFAAVAGQGFLYRQLNLIPNGLIFGLITLAAGLLTGYGGAKLVSLLFRQSPQA